MARLVGRSIIGFRDGVEASNHFYGINPANGQRLQPAFSRATPTDVRLAVQLAVETLSVYTRTSGRATGACLGAIVANIESIADKLIERASPGNRIAKVLRANPRRRALVVSSASWHTSWRRVRGRSVD